MPTSSSRSSRPAARRGRPPKSESDAVDLLIRAARKIEYDQYNDAARTRATIGSMSLDATLAYLKTLSASAPSRTKVRDYGWTSGDHPWNAVRTHITTRLADPSLDPAEAARLQDVLVLLPTDDDDTRLRDLTSIIVSGLPFDPVTVAAELLAAADRHTRDDDRSTRLRTVDVATVNTLAHHAITRITAMHADGVITDRRARDTTVDCRTAADATYTWATTQPPRTETLQIAGRHLARTHDTFPPIQAAIDTAFPDGGRLATYAALAEWAAAGHPDRVHAAWPHIQTPDSRAWRHLTPHREPGSPQTRWHGIAIDTIQFESSTLLDAEVVAVDQVALRALQTGDLDLAVTVATWLTPHLGTLAADTGWLITPLLTPPTDATPGGVPAAGPVVDWLVRHVTYTSADVDKYGGDTAVHDPIDAAAATVTVLTAAGHTTNARGLARLLVTVLTAPDTHVPGLPVPTDADTRARVPGLLNAVTRSVDLPDGPLLPTPDLTAPLTHALTTTGPGDTLTWIAMTQLARDAVTGVMPVDRAVDALTAAWPYLDMSGWWDIIDNDYATREEHQQPA